MIFKMVLERLMLIKALVSLEGGVLGGNQVLGGHG